MAMVLVSETKLEPMSAAVMESTTMAVTGSMESVVAKASLGVKESKVLDLIAAGQSVQAMGPMLAKELLVPKLVVEESLDLLMAEESSVLASMAVKESEWQAMRLETR